MMVLPFPESLLIKDIANIRLAHHDDLSIVQTFYPEHPPLRFAKYFHDTLLRSKKKHAYWLIGEVEGMIVGSAQIRLYTQFAEIADVFVVTEYRRQGIGSALICSMFAIAKHLQVSRVEIGVSVGNIPARHLYEQLGFQEKRQMIVHNKIEPALILSKSTIG